MTPSGVSCGGCSRSMPRSPGILKTGMPVFSWRWSTAGLMPVTSICVPIFGKTRARPVRWPRMAWMTISTAISTTGADGTFITTTMIPTTTIHTEPMWRAQSVPPVTMALVWPGSVGLFPCFRSRYPMRRAVFRLMWRLMESSTLRIWVHEFKTIVGAGSEPLRIPSKRQSNTPTPTDRFLSLPPETKTTITMKLRPIHLGTTSKMWSPSRQPTRATRLLHFPIMARKASIWRHRGLQFSAQRRMTTMKKCKAPLWQHPMWSAPPHSS